MKNVTTVKFNVNKTFQKQFNTFKQTTGTGYQKYQGFFGGVSHTQKAVLPRIKFAFSYKLGGAIS